jgi:hypothetical protein
MSRVFETSSVVIVKIAGQVTDCDLDGWCDFLKDLESETVRWIVLDFCDTARVDRKAAELLVRNLSKHLLLLNCPTGIKNMADSAGLRGQVLEPASCQGQARPHCFLNVNLWNGPLSGGAV